MHEDFLNDLKRRMKSALEVLQKEFAGLRTGRASAGLLDPVMVEAYGSRMPISQVGTVSVPEPRTISVHVWDKELVKAVEKGITNAGLGLNPMADGQYIRISLPELSQERRQELARIASKYAEGGRVSIRNVRRDGMEALKKMEKEGDISEDEHHRLSHLIQTMTDDHVKMVDEALDAKEAEILKV